MANPEWHTYGGGPKVADLGWQTCGVGPRDVVAIQERTYVAGARFSKNLRKNPKFSLSYS